MLSGVTVVDGFANLQKLNKGEAVATHQIMMGKKIRLHPNGKGPFFVIYGLVKERAPELVLADTKAEDMQFVS